MNKFLKLLPFLFAAASLFSACSNDESDDLYPSELTKGAYIVNYGGYGSGTSSITKYDYYAGETTEFYYQRQNNYSEITSAPQYAYSYKDRIYLMNNEPDNVIVTDPLFVAQDTITTEIVKPRACVGSGDYLYIACWGGDVWADLSLGYILKYNVNSKTVEEKIDLPGGPEKLAIANGKLYAALNYKAEVAVMDLSTEEFTSIATTENCYDMLKDNNGNLIVAMSSYVTSGNTGLGFINTQTDEFTHYPLENVSSSYASVIALSKDQSKVYVIAAGYDANWNLVGGVQVFDVSTKTFEAEPLVSDVTGINGVSVNPENGDVYVFVSNGNTTKGSMQIFDSNGTFEETKTVGAAPAMAIFLD